MEKVCINNGFDYDIVVVGGGHAGCEAALASSALGLRTLLITGAIDRIAAMSCNPAIGGVGKGHIVREIDALGGHMARVADATGIQFRILNASRGPAVQATRCQSDMARYQQLMMGIVLGQKNLQVRQDDVVGVFSQHNGRIGGVESKHGGRISARSVILTTGTFLGGKLHLGKNESPGGRAGEAPSAGLSTSLVQLGLKMGRLKTGTCARLDGRTIDRTLLEEQPPENPAPRFSLGSGPPPLRQISCYLTHTSRMTHELIADAINSGAAPIYNGQIDGKGPRYCPSIEDKVIRFGEKESHLIFLEPQGLDTHEVYPNGLSTSLPPAVQLQFLRSIRGLENVHITRWGYAVEYDFVEPTQLSASLEVKNVPGLFCAGQINGTTGYEEAAVQGLLAGLNAARLLQEKEPVVLARHQAYAGVLVDDLITKGTTEPYRMFTSRAEHRLVLREDNVYARLMDIGFEAGLLSEERFERMQQFEAAVQSEINDMKKSRLPASAPINELLTQYKSTEISISTSLEALARRPEISAQAIVELRRIAGAPATENFDALSRGLIELKYEGYIERAQSEIDKSSSLEEAKIPDSLFNRTLSGISMEVQEKLAAIRPRTLGQASRISGVTPAAISLLAIYIQKGDQGQHA